MAATPPKERTYEEHRERLLSKVPDFMIPFQMGPGVSDKVSLRELVGQLYPPSEVELAISSIPLGKLFSMAPPSAKAAMIKALRGGENKMRIAKKMLEQNPALGKAVEALGIMTGKAGGFGADIKSASGIVDTLYEEMRKAKAISQKFIKVRPTGLPEVDIGKAPQSNPSEAAFDIARGIREGMPIEPSLKMGAQSGFGGIVNEPTVTSEQINKALNRKSIDIDDIPELIRHLKGLLSAQ